MSKPHKIKIVATNASSFSIIAVCEYCGAIPFSGNHESLRPGKNIGDCPNSPEYTAVLGSEILGMIQRIGISNNGRTEQSWPLNP